MVVTDEYAAKLATRIAEHRNRGCWCTTCADAVVDLFMDGRDLSGRRLEGAST